MGVFVLLFIGIIIYFLHAVITGIIEGNREKRKENKRRLLNIFPIEKKTLHYPIILIPYKNSPERPCPINKNVFNPKKGVCDDLFYEELKKYFPSITNSYRLRQFHPDITIYDEKSKFYLDVEIDEIYNLESGKIIHAIGQDNFRNEFFRKKGWYILRFSEEQILKDLAGCCKFVAQVYAYYTLDKTPLNKLRHINNLEFSKQWDEEYAHYCRCESYREELFGMYLK